MIGCLMNNELESVGGSTYLFNVLFWHFCGGNEEAHEKPVSVTCLWARI
jgi:hypothetical protein